MPAKRKSKSETTYHLRHKRNRSKVFGMQTTDNKPEWPRKAPESPFSLSLSNTQGCLVQYGSNPNNCEGLDAGNDAPYYYAHSRSWNGALYSNLYSKFADASRQGSAEWGMNIVQGRQALKTFVQLAQTSAVTIAVFAKSSRIGLSWLRNHMSATPKSVEKRRRRLGRHLVRAREAKERLRISNELWILDQVSSTLLAYRYGVAPLMTDIATTADILSQPWNDPATLKRSGKIAFSGVESSAYYRTHWVGTERVVLKATVAVSNPNLLLANRLGIINPLTIAWDNIPWSFVIDWWLKIGTFASNLTAMVGLSLTSASVTRTRTWTGNWKVLTGSPKPQGNMQMFGKRKERSSGSLPVPLSVPIGTGLGIQRGQNALALIVQKLLSK